jgi:sporulation protein YlmC with PRC-barrel domain
VVLNASKDQVNGAPQFDKGHWPGSGDPLWRQSMQYWHQQMGMTGGMTGGRMGGREWKGGQSSGGSSSDSGSGGSAGAAAGGTAGQSGMGAGGTTGDQSGMGTAGTSGGQSGMGTGGTSGDQSAKGTGGTSGDQSGVGSAGTSGSPSGMAGKSGTYGDVNPSGDSSGMSNRGWSSEDQMGMEQGNPSPMKYRRLTQIIGLNVKDYRGDQIGEIENVMIDADHGVVAYGIIGHGGFLKIGEKITPVPWTAVQVNPQNEVARISGQEPYWVTYGYVSPEGGGAQGSFDAWRAGSAYNRNFQAGKIEHYTGTVEGVGTFTPERGSAEGLRLRVRTDQGQTITVHAGPWAYAQQQGFSSLYGQKITVTGARSTVNGRDVLMATKIEASGKTWELRDESGTPKWNVDQLQSQMGGKMGERYTGGRTGEQMTPGGSAKPGDQAAPGGSSDQGTGGSTGKTGNASPWSAG